MGYRGEIEEQNAARDLRATGMTLADIAARLGVSKSSVSLWVRDVELERRQGLDLDEAVRFWSALTEIPAEQFGAPYRAKPDPSIRRSKHPMGCPGVIYGCSRTHRSVMGLVHALLSCEALPFRGGVIGNTADC